MTASVFVMQARAMLVGRLWRLFIGYWVACATSRSAASLLGVCLSVRLSVSFFGRDRQP